MLDTALLASSSELEKCVYIWLVRQPHNLTFLLKLWRFLYAAYGQPIL
jgi:hypothetical protein